MKNKKREIRKGVFVKTSKSHIIPTITRTKEVAKERSTEVKNQLNQNDLLFNPIIIKLYHKIQYTFLNFISFSLMISRRTTTNVIIGGKNK
jgi:hypothetical protein